MKVPTLSVLVVVLPSTVSAFSALSSFTRRSSSSSANRRRRPGAFSLAMYDTSRDPPSSPDYNAWTVLSNTERWISSTLDTMNGTGGPSGTAKGKAANNPYARKEVSYACEASTDSPMVVASVFRRLREVREMGERHGDDEEARADSMGASYEPSTLRQTQVVVIPASNQLETFAVFDGLVGAINRARRNARDYVTDVALEKLDDRMVLEDDADRDWSVSVNCAHLHPKFGELTPEQQLEQMKEEDEEGEVDLHLQAYKEKRLQARRSPYPTLVIEVRAVPPPDFGQAPPPSAAAAAAVPKDQDEDGEGEDSSSVSAADVQKLEALFGKSAHVNHPAADLSLEQQEDAFYGAIGKSLTEVSTVTPLGRAQEWIAANDPDLALSPTAAAFTESPAAHVDEAYEFIFTNLAMLKEAARASGLQPDRQQRQYLVLPHFLSASATSLEKFSGEARNMIAALPDLKDHAEIETFHPEHVDPARRSPSPIFVLIWKG